MYKWRREERNAHTSNERCGGNQQRKGLLVFPDLPKSYRPRPVPPLLPPCSSRSRAPCIPLISLLLKQISATTRIKSTKKAI